MRFLCRHMAHDFRGHGGGDGFDIDHNADDVAAVVTHLDLKNAIHTSGHSTGAAEVAP